MDFEFYRNFITVAETGNLTTASKKLALAQPALSAQIKTLEHYYGAKLIQTARGKRQLTLTEAGEAFLGKARQICRTEETILLDMQSFNKKASGTLRFSVSPAKSTFSSTPICVPLRPPIPKSASSSGKKPSAPRPDILRKTAVILPLPTRRCRHRSCLPPTKLRKNIFTPFTVRRQTAALIHSSR